MLAGEELQLNTLMEVCIQTAHGTMEVSMVYFPMSQAIFGITQLRDLLMLRSGSSSDGGIDKTASRRVVLSKWSNREDLNLLMEGGLLAMRLVQSMRT